MAGSGIVKILIGEPSYKGPDKHCFTRHNEFFHYLGRLQERSAFVARHGFESISGMAPLDPYDPRGEAELSPDDPQFVFGTSEVVGVSLAGLARDRCVSLGLDWGADYIFFFDDDMRFENSVFLKLFRPRKPVVGALAFTAREPICPVIYRFNRTWDFASRKETADVQIVFDYPKDTLFKCDAVGSGVVLVDTSVFKRFVKPWFHGAIGSGEDVHFFYRCWQHNIPVYVDTSAKTRHLRNDPTWMDEERYLENRPKAEIYYNGSTPVDYSRADLSQLPAACPDASDADCLHGVPV